MDLRKAITRTITYTNVKVEENDGTVVEYVVQGATTVLKELKKVLKNREEDTIPNVSIEVVEEKRAISIEDFIKYSELV